MGVAEKNKEKRKRIEFLKAWPELRSLRAIKSPMEHQRFEQRKLKSF